MSPFFFKGVISLENPRRWIWIVKKKNTLLVDDYHNLHLPTCYKKSSEVMSKSRILSRVFIAFWHKNKDNIWFGAHFAFSLRWFSCKQKIKDIELLRWKWSRLLCWKIQGSFSSQIEDSCENLNAIQIHNNTKFFSKQKNVLLWNPWISALNWAGMMSIYSTLFQTLKIFSYYWGKKILDIEIPLHWLKISQ